MFHKAAIVLSIGLKPNPSKYMKTVAVHDFYFGEKEDPFPMGGIQLVGSFKWEMMKGEAPPLTPPIVLQTMKSRSVPWWLTTEDLPRPNNRVRWISGRGIQLDYTPKNNEKPYQRLIRRWEQVLKEVDGGHTYVPDEFYLKKSIPLEGVGHQNGHLPIRIGYEDLRTGSRCRTHDIGNLYVVDGSFFLPAARSIPRLRSSPTLCAWAITCCNV